MALSNRDRVGRAFERLAEGLGPYVDRRIGQRSPYKEKWFAEWRERERGDASMTDPAFLLKVMCDSWDLAFRDELTRTDRNIVFELREVRNRWAHNASFTADDAYRALDSIERVLVAVDAPQSEEVGKAKEELMRLRFEAEAKKATPTQEVLLTAPAAGLKPWREVAVPHDDVAHGKFSLAEFAADLYQVANDGGTVEYRDAVEFFRRTYLTEGLRTLLVDGARRLTDAGGVPIVDLQTNFGGGKTHSQIALYHLCSGRPLGEYPQELQDLMAGAGITALPEVNRAVVVGTKVPAAQPSVKPDGTEVRTLWGELAWQLGGRAAYDMIAASDEKAKNPGEHLDRLLRAYAPCLILIDEWVAHARELVAGDLPAGDFETHFSFAQALTEAVRAAPGVLLVVSLPVSQPQGATQVQGSDAEVGGANGRVALDRLRNVLGRMESPWRPATADESFEIVRRRLFKTIDADALAHRDATARVFGDLYRKERAEFPAECGEPSYVELIKRAYPIHPELFARLYEDWSTLERFQRTRGVLRLMAGVIHTLWEGNDQAPLIMPASVPLAATEVANELTKNLEDSWKPILDADIDGPSSLPVQLDRELAGGLGRFQAARRVARTIFLGSAPTLRSANKGIDAARIRLGCVVPGEPIATFGDAMNRLTSRATYLYAEGGRYWYSTQASAAKTARERAERYLAEGRDELHAEIQRRLQEQARDRGDFRGVHTAPSSAADVPDEPDVRLIILGPDHPHITKTDTSSARQFAEEIWRRRGNADREHRNALVFLVADNRKLEMLEKGVADYLAWQSVHDDAADERLNLDKSQVRVVAEKAAEAHRTANSQLGEAYMWILTPVQPDATGPVTWEQSKADGQASLPARVSRKLVSEGHLYTVYAATLLRSALDGPLASLWQAGHVSVATLWDAYSRYVYLRRLRDLDVLVNCVAAGPSSMDWETQTFAVADAFDGEAYVGLVCGEHATVTPTSLLVRPEIARRQFERRTSSGEGTGDTQGSTGGDQPTGEGTGGDESPPRYRRFEGRLTLDSERTSRDFGRVISEIVQHLSNHPGTDVTVTVDVAAENDEGFSDTTIRTVSENAKTMKFNDFGFEE